MFNSSKDLNSKLIIIRVCLFLISYFLCIEMSNSYILFDSGDLNINETFFEGDSNNNNTDNSNFYGHNTPVITTSEKLKR
jgi:hypothetical protein